MRQKSDEGDDSPAGGRALDRLRQFELERGYQDTGAVPSSQPEDAGQGEQGGGSQQGETGGGETPNTNANANASDAGLADC